MSPVLKSKRTITTKEEQKLTNQILIEAVQNCSTKLGSDMCIKVLQNAFNILAIKEKRLKVDGILGPLTIKAINSYKNPLELYVWLEMNSTIYICNIPHDVYDDKKWINDNVISQVRQHYPY